MHLAGEVPVAPWTGGYASAPDYLEASSHLLADRPPSADLLGGLRLASDNHNHTLGI